MAVGLSMLQRAHHLAHHHLDHAHSAAAGDLGLWRGEASDRDRWMDEEEERGGGGGGGGGSVKLLLMSVDVRWLQCSLALSDQMHEPAPKAPKAQPLDKLPTMLTLKSTALALRHMSCAANSVCQGREELSLHLGSCCLVATLAAQQQQASPPRPLPPPQLPYSITLVQVGAWTDKTRSWDRDVSNALKIMTSGAVAEVKAHLLAPLVSSTWLIESCFLACAWDCVTKTFAHLLVDPARMVMAQQQLDALIRAPLAVTFSWHMADVSIVGSSTPSTPTP